MFPRLHFHNGKTWPNGSTSIGYGSNINNCQIINICSKRSRNLFTFQQVKLIKTNGAVDDCNYYVLL